MSAEEIALSAEKRGLDALLGAWQGVGEVLPNPWGPDGSSTARWQFFRDPSGLYLLHDFAEERQGGGRFTAHGVFAVVPQSHELLWFAFDSVGFPPLEPARGRWLDDGKGRALVFCKETPRGTGRTTLKFAASTDGFDFFVESRLAGEEAFNPVMRAVFRRAEGPFAG